MSYRIQICKKYIPFIFCLTAIRFIHNIYLLRNNIYFKYNNIYFCTQKNTKLSKRLASIFVRNYNSSLRSENLWYHYIINRLTNKIYYAKKDNCKQVKYVVSWI